MTTEVLTYRNIFCSPLNDKSVITNQGAIVALEIRNAIQHFWKMVKYSKNETKNDLIHRMLNLSNISKPPLSSRFRYAFQSSDSTHNTNTSKNKNMRKNHSQYALQMQTFEMVNLWKYCALIQTRRFLHYLILWCKILFSASMFTIYGIFFTILFFFFLYLSPFVPNKNQLPSYIFILNQYKDSFIQLMQEEKLYRLSSDTVYSHAAAQHK